MEGYLGRSGTEVVFDGTFYPSPLWCSWRSNAGPFAVEVWE